MEWETDGKLREWVFLGNKTLLKALRLIGSEDGWKIEPENTSHLLKKKKEKEIKSYF